MSKKKKEPEEENQENQPLQKPEKSNEASEPDKIPTTEANHDIHDRSGEISDEAIEEVFTKPTSGIKMKDSWGVKKKP